MIYNVTGKLIKTVSTRNILWVYISDNTEMSSIILSSSLLLSMTTHLPLLSHLWYMVLQNYEDKISSPHLLLIWILRHLHPLLLDLQLLISTKFPDEIVIEELNPNMLCELQFCVFSMLVYVWRIFHKLSIYVALCCYECSCELQDWSFE